jgi:hypothetical protein
MPSGIDNVRAHLGWVRIGVDHATPALAVATLRAGWRQKGAPMSPKARALLITADSGGRTSTRARLWTLERQRWAAESGLRVGVSLSGDTTTSAGLRIQAALDAGL